MTKTLKLRRVGNSLGLTLPKPMLDRHGLGEGSVVTAVETTDGILLRPSDPVFEQAMELNREFSERYKNALRELAK